MVRESAKADMAFTVQPLEFTHHQLAVERKLRCWGSETHASTADVIRRIAEGRNFVLCGARGCGKASLLNETCFRLSRQADQALALGPISLQVLALRGLDSLGSQLGDWFRDYTKHLAPHLSTASLTGLPGQLADWVPFLRKTAARGGADTIVLLVTDLERVAAADRDPILRGLRDFLSGTKLLTALGCSGNLLEDEVSPTSGEREGVYDRYMLGSFDEEEMEKFFAQTESDFGYELAPAAREAVLHWTASVPYFVQALMLSVTSLEFPSGTTITPNIIISAAEGMPPSFISRFAQPLTLLENPALTSLENRALGDTQELISIMNRVGGAEVEWDYSVVRNLLRWGLVRRDVQDRMVWATPLLANWFQKAGPFIEKMPWVVEGIQLMEDRASALSRLHLQKDITKERLRDRMSAALGDADEILGDVGATDLERDGTEDIVAILLKRQTAIELLSALVVGLSFVAPGKKKKKGKKKGGGGKKYGTGEWDETFLDVRPGIGLWPISGINLKDKFKVRPEVLTEVALETEPYQKPRPGVIAEVAPETSPRKKRRPAVITEVAPETAPKRQRPAVITEVAPETIGGGKTTGGGSHTVSPPPMDRGGGRGGGKPARRGKQGGSTKRRAKPPIEEEVDSTVYAPVQASPGNSFLVQVFAHLPKQAAVLDEIAKQAEPEATKRIGSRLQKPIKRGTELMFDLTMPGLEIDEPSLSCIWRGEPTSVQFGVTVPGDFNPKDLIGTVRVCQGTVPIGHLKFKLRIVADAEAEAPSTNPVLAGNLLRYKQAFISYASADRPEVLKRVQMLNLVKVKFFQDLLTLEPGDAYEKLIYQYIDESDVVFLFWSKAASKSDWVTREIAYAKRRQAGNDEAPPDIIPVIIEGPPPAKPPAALSYLHFNDKFMYFINAEEG